MRPFLLIATTTLLLSSTAQAQTERLDSLKQECVAAIDDRQEFTQQLVDRIFNFGELGFQEFETSRYVTGILRDNGFQVEEGIAGIPTAWIARWGSGKPVISFGADIDGIPKASQKPGVAYHQPIIEGAPGHGEGHNAGALVLKRIMQRHGLPGTLMLWPGVAEEQLGTKAYFVRDGYFRDVDILVFSHIGDNFGVSYGPGRGSGLVSVEYTFRGDSAHSAGAPWRGRSALDAVELMNTDWNFRREHLRLQQRSHYVITNGGDQPNVVPSQASVWYFFREIEYPGIKELFEIGNKIARGAAMMTDTEVEWRILGSAWPRHFNKTIAEITHANIGKTGLPQWSEADQALARAVQHEVGSPQEGLHTELPEPPGERSEANYGGGSDDIGDISWTVPTVTLRYPANIPGLPGHHWSNAVAMATPISHKGTTAGAKVLAMTALDFLLRKELVDQAWDYFRNEQTRTLEYTPLIGADDRPATHLNREIMEEFRPRMKEFYFQPERYKTYLEQLGISYPTLR